MWYVVQVKTGDEMAVRDRLKEMDILALVPSENRPIRQGGQWTFKEYILFPSYVFLHMQFTADNYYKVRRIPNVIRFLGESSQPPTLTYLEAEWIKILSGSYNKPIEPTKVRVDTNGEVEILEGILKSFANRVIDYSMRSRRASFEITICNEVKMVQLGIEVISDKENIE